MASIKVMDHYDSLAQLGRMKYNRPKRLDFSSDKEYKAAYMRARYRENAEWVRQYKVGQGCADCGYREHHAGLEFDHLEARNGDQSRTIAALMGKSINRIKAEIAKCEVVCGTCHRIRTWNRLQNQINELDLT
jgi:hypothetical protein